MKGKPRDLEGAIDRAGRGGGDHRLFLLHGPDEAGAMEHVAHLARAMGDAAERIDIDGASLRAQPGRLADEAAALSLFGDRRWIRVTPLGEDGAEAIALLLASDAAVHPVIAVAPTAKATGKLVKAATASPRALAVGCYMPDARDAVRLAGTIGRDHGLRIAPDVAAALFDAAGGDRAILTREIEKLALYCDAAPDRPQDCDAAAVAAVGADGEEVELSTAIAAVVAGDAATLGADLAALVDANQMIPVLRGLERRLLALLQMRSDIDGGDTPDRAMERARVFFKERGATEHALRHWSTSRLAAAIAQVRRAERVLLAPGWAVDVVASQSLLTLARIAARY